MSQPATRRTFVASAVAIAIAMTFPILTREDTVRAGTSGTPAASTLGQFCLPELNVTVTTDSLSGMPASVAAGRYLLKVNAQADPTGKSDLSLAILQLPAGITLNDVEAESKSSATPAAESGPPVWFYDALLPGGVTVMPGQPSEIVMDLTPGDWLAGAGNLATPPFEFTVTGEMPGKLAEPKSNATITYRDFSIEMTAAELKSGENIVRIENAGSQPHELLLMRGPDGMTKDQLKGAIEAEMTGTPVAGGLNPNTDLVPVAGTNDQSAGTTTWVPFNLEPGTYAALCFFSDKNSDMPHAAMGMYNVFQVKDSRVMRVTNDAEGWTYA